MKKILKVVVFIVLYLLFAQLSRIFFAYNPAYQKIALSIIDPLSSGKNFQKGDITYYYIDGRGNKDSNLVRRKLGDSKETILAKDVNWFRFTEDNKRIIYGMKIYKHAYEKLRNDCFELKLESLEKRELSDCTSVQKQYPHRKPVFHITSKDGRFSAGTTQKRRFLGLINSETGEQIRIDEGEVEGKGFYSIQDLMWYPNSNYLFYEKRVDHFLIGSYRAKYVYDLISKKIRRVSYGFHDLYWIY